MDAYDWDADDFLDLADEFGTVVDDEPGLTGFVDFGLAGFEAYSRALVVAAREPAIPLITSSLDHKIATQIIKVLEQIKELPDPYVAMLGELRMAVVAYEWRDMGKEI